MAPILVSILVGVGVKVGLGLAATAAKKLIEPAGPAAAAPSFRSLLKGVPPTPRARPVAAGTVSIHPPPRVPYDLPGRLTAERLHGLALDVEARRGVPGSGLGASWDADGPLAAYRRLEPAPRAQRPPLERVRVGVPGT